MMPASYMFNDFIRPFNELCALILRSDSFYYYYLIANWTFWVFEIIVACSGVLARRSRVRDMKKREKSQVEGFIGSARTASGADA